MTLSDNNLHFAASLMIRVGVWVSAADDTDKGRKSEKAEEARLQEALARIEQNAKTPMVAECARAARALPVNDRRDTEDSLTRDLTRSLTLFGDDEKSMREYRQAIMHVGRSVARAYREELDHHEDEFMLENLTTKIAGAMNRDSDPVEFRDQNISPAEESALTMISKALTHKRQKDPAP